MGNFTKTENLSLVFIAVKIREKIKEEVIEMFKKVRSLKKVAEYYGVTTPAIAYHIRNAGIDIVWNRLEIADEDINVICPFTTNQNELFSQNQRFGLVRWGSQSEIILPIDKRYDFELCQKDTYHVESGLDPLIKIIHKK